MLDLRIVARGFGTAAVLLGLLAAPACADTAALRPDGTVLVAAGVIDGAHKRAVLTAIRADGTVDPAFGTGGAVRQEVDATAGGDLAILEDGSTHVLHIHNACAPNSAHYCHAMARLRRFDDLGATLGETDVDYIDMGGSFGGYVGSLAASGNDFLELDNLLGPERTIRRVSATGETVDSAVIDREQDSMSSVEAMGDGAIVVGRDEVGRYDSDLEPVTAFGEDGWAALPFDPDVATAAGETVLAAGDDKVARLRADGSPDPDFGAGGFATVAAGTRGLRLSALVALPGGGLLAGGTTTDADHDFAVVRLLPSGLVDPDFGDDGAAIVDFGAQDALEDVLVRGSGEIVATGGSSTETDAGAQRQVAVAQLTAAGTLDTEFGEGGRALATFDIRPPALEILTPSTDPADVDGRAVQVSARSPEAGVVPICTLYGQSKPCAEPAVFEGVPHGFNRLYVRAADAAGNTTSLERTLNVAPWTRLLSGPPPETTQTTATFTWESGSRGHDGSVGDFVCRVDQEAWSWCESPRTVSGLADGRHTFSVRQSLPNLLDEISPPQHEWRVGPSAQPETPGPRVEPDKPADATPSPSPSPSPSPPVDPRPSLAEIRAAAVRGLRVRPVRGRSVLTARGVVVRIGSAVDARLAVAGTVVTRRGKRIRLRTVRGRIAAGKSSRVRLKLTARGARRLRRAAGKRVTVRVRITLSAAAGVRLAKRTVTVRLVR